MRATPSPRDLRLPLLLALLIWLLPSVAGAVQAHLEMDVQQLRVGETASLRLVVTGGAADSSPALPPVDNLSFTPQRPTSQLVSINFQTSRIVTYSWAVRATAVGDATIGPVSITVGGRPLRAAPLEISVSAATPGDVGPNLLVATLDPSPVGLAEGAPVPLWQGQALVYRFSFSHRDTVYGAEWTQPTFEGLELVQGIESKSRDYSLQRGQHQYTVHDAELPLRATSPGRFEIPPSVVTAQFPVERSQRQRRRDPFEDFFGAPFGGSMFAETRTEVLASNALSVEIRPLPTQGRPAGFDGLVGSLEVQAELAEDQVRVGDSVTLTITVRGDGVLAGIELPPAQDTEQLRAYDDEPEVLAGVVGGAFRSRATLRRALVPTKEGTIQLPPVTLHWFDPAQERYVSWSLPIQELEVLPGEPGTAPAVVDFGGPQAEQQEPVASLGEDILPIHADVQATDARFRPTSPLPLALVLLPGLLLLVQLAQDLRMRGGSLGRRKRAVRARLDALPAGRSERLAALDAAFRDAAGLALGTPPAGVAPDRLREGLPEPLGEEAAALYRQLEGARFAGMDPGDLEPVVRAMVGRLLGRVR
jgi:hypothetical protein